MIYIAQTVFTPNDLQHFGVKGMRWGVRNKRPQASSTHPRAAGILKKALKGAAYGAVLAGGAYAGYKIGDHIGNKYGDRLIRGQVQRREAKRAAEAAAQAARRSPMKPLMPSASKRSLSTATRALSTGNSRSNYMKATSDFTGWHSQSDFDKFMKSKKAWNL